MDTNIIRQLIEMFEKSGITDMELEAEGIKMKPGKRLVKLQQLTRPPQLSTLHRPRGRRKNRSPPANR